MRVSSRHDGIRSSPRCIDVKIQRKTLVEIALTRLIQRRVSFKSASRRICVSGTRTHNSLSRSQMNLPIFLLQKICCMRLIMEQVTGFEPVSSAWQAEILTIILYLHIWSRQQESNLQPTDYKSVALPIAPRRQRKEKSSVSSFNLTHPRWSYTTLVLWCLAPQRSWSSECSIGEAGIVFT